MQVRHKMVSDAIGLSCIHLCDPTTRPLLHNGYEMPVFGSNEFLNPGLGGAARGKLYYEQTIFVCYHVRLGHFDWRFLRPKAGTIGPDLVQRGMDFPLSFGNSSTRPRYDRPAFGAVLFCELCVDQRARQRHVSL